MPPVFGSISVPSARVMRPVVASGVSVDCACSPEFSSVFWDSVVPSVVVESVLVAFVSVD